jgi:predicted restriction endonuclease
MAITDKNRKILWARSGNRCAICRISLVVEQTVQDSESVVGEECHIVSSSPNGPRHDAAFTTEQSDAIDNFILLCATHHKMIDDQ